MVEQSICRIASLDGVQRPGACQCQAARVLLGAAARSRPAAAMISKDVCMKKALGVATLFILMVFSVGASAQAWDVPKPSQGLMPNPSAGKPLFEKNCASCHGVDLSGTDKGPTFLNRVYEPSHHGDVAFQLAAKNGARAHHWKFGDMPPVPGVTPDDVAHITAYVRMHQRKAGIR